MKMKEYKLFNTDGKTFFDFRSNPDSRCEGFTLSYLDDRTVVMSGDYGTLCWKRDYNGRKDYGFPNDETNISYFAEKVCQWGVKQEIQEWNKELAIKQLKQYAKDYEFEEDGKYKDALEEIEWLEEYQSQRFFEIINNLGHDLWECNIGVRYTHQFKSMFEKLKSISNQVWDAVENSNNNAKAKGDKLK